MIRLVGDGSKRTYKTSVFSWPNLTFNSTATVILSHDLGTYDVAVQVVTDFEITGRHRVSSFWCRDNGDYYYGFISDVSATDVNLTLQRAPGGTGNYYALLTEL